MKIRCEYCDGYLEDTDENCPNCAAVNRHLKRSADGVPKTIEELIEFASAKKLPLEEMRFFLGKDIREPRVFGIYKNAEGNFVVYKNKSNGERVIRYEGKDEAYAVNEIYQKIKTEIIEQKEHQVQQAQKRPHNTGKSYYEKKETDYDYSGKSSGNVTLGTVIIIGIVLFLVFSFLAYTMKELAFGSTGGDIFYEDGYYYYDSNNDDYDSDWDFLWDDDDDDEDDYDWDDDWDSGWDDDDWDVDFDWDDSLSDWDSDW